MADRRGRLSDIGAASPTVLNRSEPMRRRRIEADGRCGRAERDSDEPTLATRRRIDAPLIEPRAGPEAERSAPMSEALTGRASRVQQLAEPDATAEERGRAAAATVDGAAGRRRFQPVRGRATTMSRAAARPAGRRCWSSRCRSPLRRRLVLVPCAGRAGNARRPRRRRRDPLAAGHDPHATGRSWRAATNC